MVYQENNEYYRVCDDCKDVKQITRWTFVAYLKKENHYCGSCFQKGERNHSYGKRPWNYELTKKTDERVKGYGLKGSQSKLGSEPWNKGHSYAELKSEEWAENFKNKLTSVKKGKPNLKRRKTTAYNKSFKALRSACKSLLYCYWTRPILERDNFECQNCGNKKKLEVHHIVPFRDIMRKAANNAQLDLNKYMEWSEEELEKFRKEILDLHKLEDGITLCAECHKKIDKYRKRFEEKRK